MHMQHQTDSPLLGNLRKYLGAFGAIMDIKRIPPAQSIEDWAKKPEINRLLYHPGRSVYRRVNLITQIPVRQTKEPVGGIAPRIVERLTNNFLVSIPQNIRDPPGDGSALDLRERLCFVEHVVYIGH
jgi:hypothetical protein